jgi:hypothetical protein
VSRLPSERNLVLNASLMPSEQPRFLILNNELAVPVLKTTPLRCMHFRRSVSQRTMPHINANDLTARNRISLVLDWVPFNSLHNVHIS